MANIRKRKIKRKRPMRRKEKAQQQTIAKHILQLKNRIMRILAKRKIFRYSLYALLIIGFLSFIYTLGPRITGLFVADTTALDRANALFITMDDYWSGNELSLYTLVKENYAGKVLRVKMSDITKIDLSKYDYMVVSIDASGLVTDRVCQFIADSKIPFIYSSRNFNSECMSELHLTTGSLCSPNESPVWDIAENSHYPTSHIRDIPQKIAVFRDEFSIGLCAIENDSLYSKPTVLAKRDQIHGYLIIFEDGLQRRAFFALPNHDFDLTDEGKVLLGRTILWLTGE